MENIFLKFQDVFIVASFVIVIIVNICIFRYIINRALKKSVIPLLKSKGLVFIGYKWVGLFDTGDFEENTIDIGPSMSFGRANLSIYIYVNYYTVSKQKTRVTVRIDTLFLFIRKVAYSNHL